MQIFKELSIKYLKKKIKPKFFGKISFHTFCQKKRISLKCNLRLFVSKRQHYE